MMLGGGQGNNGLGDNLLNLQMGSLGLNEGSAIEKMILNLKTKVLNGETLNNFKKEIA